MPVSQCLCHNACDVVVCNASKPEELVVIILDSGFESTDVYWNETMCRISLHTLLHTTVTLPRMPCMKQRLTVIEKPCSEVANVRYTVSYHEISTGLFRLLHCAHCTATHIQTA